MLRAAALAEAQPEHPVHIAGVWLAALLWLEDGRWRKLRSRGAPTDALEALLDALSRRVRLLSLAPPDQDAAQTLAGAAAGSLAADEQALPWDTGMPVKEVPLSQLACARSASRQLMRPWILCKLMGLFVMRQVMASVGDLLRLSDALW